jgi:PPM family protein phosphatase
VTLPAVRVSQRSFIGARSRNEDCVGVEFLRGHWCLVLSDGAGGHRDGALASRLAVDRVLKGFRSRPPVDPDDLAELVLDAHDAVVAAQRLKGVTGGVAAMHATVVVLMIDTGTGNAIWAHVGDSRLYLGRDGRFDAVTRDDSVMQFMFDAGVIDAERMKKASHRGALLAALGSAEDIEPHVSGPFELRESDVLLLCSDGWWSALDTGEIDAALTEASSPEDWLEAMAASTQGRRDPEQDNYSAIGCWIGEPRWRQVGEADTQPVVFADLRGGRAP